MCALLLAENERRAHICLAGCSVVANITTGIMGSLAHTLDLIQLICEAKKSLCEFQSWENRVQTLANQSTVALHQD